MKYVKFDGYRTISLANGTEVQFLLSGNNQRRRGMIYLNLNVTNKYLNGIDLFGLTIVNYDGKSRITSAESYDTIMNSLWVNDAGRSKVITYCSNGWISSGADAWYSGGEDVELIDAGAGRHQIYCAALIEANGWKIPDDYPIKL